MYEMIKQFFNMVFSKTGEEICQAGRGMEVMLLCMVAFFCIILGLCLDSRCVVVYYVMPKGQKKLLGNLYIREEKGKFLVKMPKHFLEQSESIYYVLRIPRYFAKDHYMEEMVLELPSGKKRYAIKKTIQFKTGLQ